ncbi:hypothetical protein WJX77_006083 [Trebouxia sp. C0004]
MPRASRSKPPAAALDLKSTSMAAADGALDSGATVREGHVSENSDTSPVSVDASAYSRGFGTSDGLCSCARCLRKSAPFTSDYREAVNDVARCLARLDPDFTAAAAEELFIQGTTTIQTSAPDDRSQELAEAICQAAIEQADPVQLGELLSSQVVDNVIAAEIADVLALLAAQRGHASIIPVLADNGAQFDRPDFHRRGPLLMHAANNGHASTVAALLEGNADIDDMDNAGQTALMVAVFSDRAQAAEVLIKHGKADLEAEDDIGRTAVSHAAKYGSVDCLNLLGNAHADVFHKDREGKTPLQIAEVSSRSEAVLALKKWQQLQTMRMRCEKKRQKDATQQQAELTVEQIAERKAKADAFAEALLAEDAAEKERGQSQKLKAKKAKAKGKGKAAPTSAPIGDNLPAAADAAPKVTVPSATETQLSPDQAHHRTGQTNTESPDTEQQSAAPQASTIETSDGASTVQPGPAHSVNKDSHPLDASHTECLSPRPQSPVPDASAPLTASQIPVHYAPQELKPSAESSSASSPMQSPRPRSAASEADSVQDPPSPSAAAASLHSARAQLPSMKTRSSQSSPGQQAYEARLHNALSPAAKPPMQSQASQPNSLVSSSSRAPASCPSSAAASPAASAMSDMIAAMSRPSSASPASKSGQVSPQLSGSVASAASSRPVSAGSQQYQPNVHVTEVPVSGTATPARSATQSLLQSPRLVSAPASQAPPVKPNRAPSAAEQAAQAAMAAITGLRAAPVAAHKAPPAAIKAISVGTEAPVTPAEESAVPSSPPVTTPVRKPPGLPSPVTHLSGQDSAELDDAAISSDRWADQVSSKSDTASNPGSPTKVVAASHPTQPSQPAPLSGTAWSEALSESASDDGSHLSQVTGNGQPLDMSMAAVAERLAREQKQQREQEAKHLASKARAAKRRAKEIAEQDRRQQEEHAARAEAKARQRREKAEKEALAGRSIAGPFQGLSSNRGAALRGGPASREERRDYDEPLQQAPKSYPAGVRHVPAHPAPRAAALEHHNGRSMYTGGSGSEYDHSPGPDSDYGAGSEDYDYVPTRGGRGAARGRGAAIRGRGGRGPPPQERGGRGQAARNAPQPEAVATDPRAFIPGLAMSAAPRVPPDRANPDPLAFGTVVAGPRQQLNALLLQVPAMKEDPEQEFGLQFLLREIKKVQSSAAKQGISLPVEADMAARELTATLGARAQLQAAISARPVNALALQVACEAGRECKLLHRGLLMAADSKLRNIRAKANPEAAAYFIASRQQFEAGPYDPRQQHPDTQQHPDGRTQRGELKQPRGEPKRGSEARGRPDSRQRGDPRPQHLEARPHAEPRQQQYVPQQPHPQYEPHCQHAPPAEARNGRQVSQEFAEVLGGKHQRGHANPANPPRKGTAPRNPGAAANAGYTPDRVPGGGAASAANSNAAQSQRSHKPAVKDSAGPEGDDCVVCWAHEKDVVCIPCGHVAMCKSCSKAVMQQSGLCPVCRQEVREIIQLFRT